MKLECKKIWNCRAEVCRQQRTHRTADVVRCNGHRMYFSKVDNTLSDGQTTNLLKIGSHDAQGVFCDDFFNPFEQEKILSSRDRHSHFRTDFSKRSNAICRYRLFKPQESKWL